MRVLQLASANSVSQ